MRSTKWYSGLRFQIVLLLTLALLPLGAIAVYQTNRVEGQAAHSARIALLALTERAARAEERMLERATGVVESFAAVAGDFVANPERCLPNFSRFIETSTLYTFIGIIPLSGVVTCSSSGDVMDFSGTADFDEAMRDQASRLDLIVEGRASGTSVFVLSEPFFVDGVFSGFVSLSIPYEGVPKLVDRFMNMGLVDLLTLSSDGEILTTLDGIVPEATELPRDFDPQQVQTSGRSVFAGVNMSGQDRIYTVVPINGTPAVLMGVWRPDEGFAGRHDTSLNPAVFPVLMWIASMAVAVLSVYTLVLRHISRIQRNMDTFSENRGIRDRKRPQIAMPRELQALSAHFDRLTDDIMREEARLEDTLRAKNVLIKEVHHRVKNNLQLIASIMSMHIRTAKHAETRSVLARVQERVLSLATIHRDLYTSHDAGRVDAAALVTEIIDKSLETTLPPGGRVDVQRDIDPVLLYPDQAVPLSLMVAEAMTNVMKYLGTTGDKSPQITATLKQEGQRCTITIANSVSPEKRSEGPGLGSQLIDAFAIQLGGTPKVAQLDGRYIFTLDFAVADFQPETRDY